MQNKKLFGLFVNQEIDENGVIFPNSSFLICASSNMDKLLEYSQILQKASDLIYDLMPSRNLHSKYRVDEINFLDVL